MTELRHPQARAAVSTWRSRRPLSALARSQSDPESFVEVYDEFASCLLRFFARRVDDGQAAVDLTADTLATAYEKRQDFRGSSPEEASAWIWRIAHRKHARYWRWRRVDQAAMHRIGLERQIATDHELERIQELLALEVTGKAVNAALAELPVDQQRVIRMRYLEDMSDQAIAQKLAVSREVVRARASRGLRRMRRDRGLRGAMEQEDPAL